MSDRLTMEAKSELQTYNYKKAYDLLQKAVILNPSNDEAKDIYVKLNEMISEAENKKNIKHKKRITSSVPGKEDTIELDQPDIEDTDFSPTLSLNIGLLYTFGKSNFIPDVNTDVQMPGVRIETVYYTGFSNNRLGFSADYTINPQVTKGDERIDFTLHRANAFILLRERFFESGNGAFIPGIRTGYHYFSLQNKMDQGAYYFTGALCPAAGVFISDPVFSRIVSGEFSSRFGIEAGADYMPVYQEEKLVNIYNFSIALTCRFELMDISLGYRSYNLNNGEVHERFSDIQITARYTF